MKLLRTLRLFLTQDTDGLEKGWDVPLERAEDSAAVVSFESSGWRKVAAGASNVAMSLGGVTTAGFLLVASDQDITVKLNGGSEAIAIKKGAGGRGMLYLEGAITSLTISNAGSSDALVLLAAAGV